MTPSVVVVVVVAWEGCDAAKHHGDQGYRRVNSLKRNSELTDR